jgi:hypothetical protein
MHAIEIASCGKTYFRSFTKFGLANQNLKLIAVPARSKA